MNISDSLKEESRIDFKRIPNDLIELSGTEEKVMEVKDRLTTTLNGMVRFEVKIRDYFVDFLNDGIIGYTVITVSN